jgi:hypothetical protein
MAMIGGPSCGVSVVVVMHSFRCASADIYMDVSSLYSFFLTARMAPADRRFVVRSSLGDVGISL